MAQEQTTRICNLWMGTDGICRLDYLPYARVLLEDAQEVMAAYRMLSQGKRLPLLVNTRKLEYLSREARLYFAGDETATCASAVGILVGTPTSRVLGNFYLGLTSPSLPTQLFDFEQAALTWLKRFIA